MKTEPFILLMLLLIPLVHVAGQGNDIEVKLVQKEVCLSGFNCTLFLEVTNLDGNLKLVYTRLITPWGIFPKKLNWVRLRRGETVEIPVEIRVGKEALSGHSMVTPMLAYLKEGEIGFKYYQGNTTLILVKKPEINISIYISPVKEKFEEGEPIKMIASYVVRGVPEGTPLNLLISMDGELIEEFLLSRPSGNLTFSLPSPGIGEHNVSLKLCYLVGCSSKGVMVKVIRRSLTVLDKGLALKAIDRAKQAFEEAYNLYKAASNDTIPLNVENITSLLALANTNIKEAEKLISRDPITLADVMEARNKAIYAENLSKMARRLIVAGYIRVIKEYVHDIEDLLNKSSRLLGNSTVSSYLSRLKSIWEDYRASLERGNPSKVYKRTRSELDSLYDEVSSRVKEARREAQSITIAMIPLLLIIMVSTTMIIIRLWRGKLEVEGEEK